MSGTRDNADSGEGRFDTDPTSPEFARSDPPRIYVASLSDYNNGQLHGVWIDADQDPDDLHEAVETMLASSVEEVAEDWAIHDYEGFGAYPINEYQSLEIISMVARGITEHGIAFAHWAAYVDPHNADELARFEDSYLGQYDSAEAFAEELLNDIGIDQLLDEIPEPWRRYIQIDVAGFARDLSADYLMVEDDGGTHVFGY